MNVKISPYFSLDVIYQYILCSKFRLHRSVFSDLCLTLGKEFERVDSVSNSATDDGQPVEYHRRSMGGFEEYLLQNRGDDDDHRKREKEKRRIIRDDCNVGTHAGGEATLYFSRRVKTLKDKRLRSLRECIRMIYP